LALFTSKGKGKGKGKGKSGNKSGYIPNWRNNTRTSYFAGKGTPTQKFCHVCNAFYKGKGMAMQKESVIKSHYTSECRFNTKNNKNSFNTGSGFKTVIKSNPKKGGGKSK